MNFQELHLSRPVLRAVAEAGYQTPSPIQAGAIPPVLAGRDLLGCAQTGTGKTAAFGLPMLDRLAARPAAKKGAVRALILTPTRELALQIGESLTAYSKYLSLRNTVIFGGVGQAPQVAALRRGTDILVACPGRLNDLIGQGVVDLSCVEIFVLDEADRMLDMGFVHDVKKVIAKLPAQRQNLLFSATMPAEIEQLAGSILHDPAFVKVDPVSSTVDRIEQSLYYVQKADKRQLLPWLLQNLDPPVQNALVFSRTKHGADKIVRDLTRAGIPAAAIHGNKSQSARVAALEGFKQGKTKVLVATDIAARGIDISELSHVFNYDLPEVPETYVHRIGRTARAGADGTAISFCAPEEREYLTGIEKLNRRKIPVVQNHPWEQAGSEALPVSGGKKKENDMEEKEKRDAREGGNDRKNSRRPRRENTNNREQGNAQRPARNAGNGAAATQQAKFDPHFISAGNSGPALRGSSNGRPNRMQRENTAQVRDVQGSNAAAANNAPRGKNDARNAQNERRGQNTARNEGRREQSARPGNQQRPGNPPRNQQPAQNEPRPNAQQPANPPRTDRAPRPAPTPRPPQPPRPPRPETPPRPPRNEPPARPVPPRPPRSRGPVHEEDPGLLLITRRPPQQKFSNFEDYMTAHGGATAPIEEYSGE